MSEMPAHRRFPIKLSLAVACVLVAGWPALSPAQEKRQDGVDVSPIADEIVKVLKRSGKTQVAMGDFTSPPQTNASAGPVIKKNLADELAARGITIKKRTEWGISGRYHLAELADKGLAAQIEGRIEDRGGMEVFSGTWDLGEESAIVTLFGPTTALPLNKGEEARKKALRESIEAPKASIQGNLITGGGQSPYALEISAVAGTQQVPLTPADDEGLAFVPIKRGQEYVITLVNDSDEDAAVTITIDGLNIFTFSENKAYRYVIVPKKSRGVIKGWHRTNEVSDAFLITEFAKGAAAEIGASGADVGTITATFAAAWPKDAPAPKAEQPLLASRGGKNATARGPEVQSKYREVERKVGAPRSVISVRYSR